MTGSKNYSREIIKLHSALCMLTQIMWYSIVLCIFNDSFLARCKLKKKFMCSYTVSNAKFVHENIFLESLPFLWVINKYEMPQMWNLIFQSTKMQQGRMVWLCVRPSQYWSMLFVIFWRLQESFSYPKYETSQMCYRRSPSHETAQH